MSEHSDKKLLEVLEFRNKYQELAIEAAVQEALNRGLIESIEDVNEKFPIEVNLNELDKKIDDEGFYDFKKKIPNIILVLILNFIWIFIVVQINYNLNHTEFSIFNFWYPVFFSFLVYYTYNKYNKLLANIVVWLTALTFVLTIISILYTIYSIL
ncbi:hypothetical protein [Flavobacterium lacisediminis]|uniref:Uncharacterized protein n=1 Tax=Flavobacterium lacisediminis TaxID=2989705 RepID=A0ABT3EL81_9FLAO|nr:hypothetical protein [Flavobacterium lacisediminis]MCW1149184.1 hypothetical protein [Flavobacterium lacisediminis]